MDTLHHLQHHLNFWAILTTAVLQWILGALWYSPVLFVKPWMKCLKIDPEAMKSGAPKKGLVLGMVSSFVGSFLASFVLDHFLLWSGASTAPTSLMIAALSWLGFIAGPSFAQGIYEQRPQTLFLINSGYWLACLLISAPILALWH